MKISVSLPSPIAVVALVLPPRSLFPNVVPRSVQEKIRYRKEYAEYRDNAGWHLKTFPVKRMDTVAVRCVFYFKDRRQPDPDACLAAMKGAIDAMQVKCGGFLKDDRFVTHLPVERCVDKSTPRVEMEIYDIDIEFIRDAEGMGKTE